MVTMAYRNQPGRTYRRGDARTVKDQVDHMLRSLGERVVAESAPVADRARGLGSKLLDMDAAYAKAVADATVGPRDITGGMTRGVPLRDVFVNPGQADTLADRVALHAMDAGVLGANVASRYALPAAGVTLAGKGLMDIAAGLSPEEEENLMIRYS